MLKNNLKYLRGVIERRRLVTIQIEGESKLVQERIFALLGN
jgi:hypothetical protein